MIMLLFDGLRDDLQTFNWLQLFATIVGTYFITKYVRKAYK